MLFVDDDVAVLEEFRDLLFMSGVPWNVVLASSGEQAMRMLEDLEVDVIVADLKMPGMDGAELLALVRDEYPDVMRILMSGNSDVQFTAQLVPQAHQFLLKPLSVDTVFNVVERVDHVGRRLADSELKQTLSQITELPRPSQSVLRLNSLLDSADSDVNEVADVVEQDIALTVKLFQLVNSAYYGLSRNIQEVREAISYLGMTTVRNLAVSIEVFRTVSATAMRHEDVVGELHEHGNATAALARQLVLGREQGNEAFVGGLLHDVGLLALVSYMPDRFEELKRASESSSLSLWDLELDIIGANHADLGAYLLNFWGLSFPIVEAVARHHDSADIAQRKMDAAHAVGVASAIVTSQQKWSALPFNHNHPLDTTYFKELGVLERVAGLMAVGVDTP